MLDEDALATRHRGMHGEEVKVPEFIQGHAYEVKLIGANENLSSVANDRTPTHYNYFIGNNPETWRSDVAAYREVLYKEVYKGIDARYYFTAEGNLKYDFVLEPRADVGLISMQYVGVDNLELIEGNLVLSTSVEDVVEMAPFAYQEIEGERVRVDCEYILQGDVVKFEIGDYHKKYPLVIDPELVFSSFAGSSADNFGFTATYSVDGGLYGGGIVFNRAGSYPTTRGAFQIGFSGPRVDIGISKFSADGKTLVYSTYLGGGEDELPYSLVETKDKSLVIYGSTGSSDFPTRPNAFERVFKGGTNAFSYFRNEVKYPSGSDIFICTLDSLGGSLPGATLYGGTENEGFNSLDFNYGDLFRGEVTVDSSGNVYVVGTTASTNLTVGPEAYIRQSPGDTNGFVASFDAGLTTLRWASYLGGSDEDNALSVKVASNQQSVYLCGGTRSDDMNFADTAYQKNRLSGVDGYIVKLKSSNGKFLAGTYNGTYYRDLNYFLDIDFLGDVYVLGQTRGDYPVSADTTIFNVAGSGQYIHKFNGDLTSSVNSTVFGSGTHFVNNISPTAFMVDDCRNIYVSGWGGEVNQGANHNQGWTRNMPLTSDAFQSTTDGSDFYFMVLDASWKKLTYATYFGGNNWDHVDGGTSRFSPSGTIYQAVCGGCTGNSDWPTTDGVYSRYNNSSNCNLAVLKMNFEALEVKAAAVPDVDSACVPFPVKITNKSFNADVFQWIMPNGVMVNSDIDSIYIDKRGRHEYKIIGIDTMCNSIDTSSIIIYGFDDSINASFSPVFDSCSNILEVNFKNTSTNDVNYHWDFGDGHKSSLKEPRHNYVKAGDYDITLIVENKPCGVSDTIRKKISLVKRVNSDDFAVDYEPCEDGGTVNMRAWGTYFQEYKWKFGDGEILYGQNVEHTFEKSGKQHVVLSLKDTICNRFYTKDTIIEVFTEGYVPWMPNIFTPNGDEINDFFGIPIAAHPEFFASVDLKIFNRWGTLLYHTSDPYDQWDGTFEGRGLAEGVYFYILNVEDACANQTELKGFVHLMNQ